MAVTDQELDGIYAFAVQLGKDAGEMLMTAARRRMQGESSGGTSSTVAYVQKENSVDIVTKTDNGMNCCRSPASLGTIDFLDVEEFIHSSVLDKYPSHRYAHPSSASHS